MENNENSQDDEEFKRLLKLIGNFIRRERKRLGYKNAEIIANRLNMSDSQFRAYERGDIDLKISSFFDIFSELNKSIDDIFKETITNGNHDQSYDDLALSPEQEHQVKHQVESALSGSSQTFTSDQLNKIYKLLIICMQHRKKSEIVAKLKLSSKTRSLEKALSAAIEADWIKMRYPEQPKRRDQMYITTEKGKKVLKAV